MATYALAAPPGAAALPDPAIPVPGAVATLRDLPTELQLHIYDLIIDDDTVVIPSQLLHIYQLPKVNGRAPARPKHDFDVTSKFFQAFGGDTRMRDNYRTTLMEHVTEKSAKVRVNIVDCNFNHALRLLRGLDKPLLRFYLGNEMTRPGGIGIIKFKHRTTSALDATPSSLNTFFKEDKQLLKAGIDLNAVHKIKNPGHIEDDTAFHKFLAARSSIHYAKTDFTQEKLLLRTFRNHHKDMTRAPRVRPGTGFQVWASQPPVHGHVTEQKFGQMVEASRAAMIGPPPPAPPAQQAPQVQQVPQVPHPPQAPQATQATQPAVPTTGATGGAIADSDDDEMQDGDQQGGDGDGSLTAGEGSAEADAVAGAEQEDMDQSEDEEGSDEEMDYGSDEDDDEARMEAKINNLAYYSRDDD